MDVLFGRCAVNIEIAVMKIAGMELVAMYVKSTIYTYVSFTVLYVT